MEFPNSTIAYLAGLVTGIVGIILIIRGLASEPHIHNCKYCDQGD